MPGDHGEFGIGKGNGSGSQRTQFRAGQPSANPKGRPRKPRVAPSNSLLQAIMRRLSEPVSVYDGAKHKWMSRFDAIALVMVAQLADAELRDQLGLLRELNRMGGMLEEQHDHRPSEDVIADVLAQLSAEADREA